MAVPPPPPSTSSDKDIGSPKSRTWKGLVARQFRRIQGGPSSPSTAAAGYGEQLLPEGASIGVPLALCPMVSQLVFRFQSYKSEREL